jgi:AcrR family transcriptional regulator
VTRGGSGWDGELTRARLVESAERLFAERGVGSVSIREVNRDAGQAPSAVHYHFGSKEALLRAVVGRLDSVVGEGTRTRGRLLLARDEPPTARELVELAAVPFVSALDADPVRASRWLKIVSTLSWGEASRMWPDLQDQMMTLLTRAYPQVPEPERFLRFAIAFATLTQVLAQVPTDTSEAGQQQRDRHIRACVDFVATGLDGAMILYARNPPGSGRQRMDVASSR